MTGDELREKFLLFFEQRGHTRVPSSSLVPLGDPTLLLTSAGMVQFKPYFTGEAVAPAPRLASCQKCFRTTDIESVGNLKHLTFFEMLGNFSIGDYFKKEAIAWAWEFVLDWLKLPQEKLWVTIFLDDDESFSHWQEIGVATDRILRFGEKDNFWGPAGETGPCGPCSEIHYDFGEEYGCGSPDCSPACACERFLEIWNLVFTEYYQDAEGKRTPLPRKNIDTGMGFERTVAVLQGIRSPYDTDLFAPIIKKVSELVGRTYGEDEHTDRAMRVVAEHSRAATFLIADGVRPSNEGRGYVLRRILRRAAMFGKTMGLEKPFVCHVADVVIAKMGHIYPELVRNHDTVIRVIETEEARFAETLGIGLLILRGIISLKQEAQKGIADLEKNIKFYATEAALVSDENQLSELKKTITKSFLSSYSSGLAQLAFMPPSGMSRGASALGAQQACSEVYKIVDDIENKIEYSTQIDIRETVEAGIQELYNNIRTISGPQIFELYDTYGFPAELATEVAAENGLKADIEGFEKEMEQQRERARSAHKFVLGEGTAMVDYAALDLPSTEFVGYRETHCKAKVLVLSDDGGIYEVAHEGQRVDVVLDRTPFYAEKGGQMGDTGEIAGGNGRIAVEDVIWFGADIVVHRGTVMQGVINVGEQVTAAVDLSRRLDVARNHTATHLLHAALRQVLGDDVHQAGSLVAPDHFRFDFSQEAPVLKEELSQIQQIVNENIRRNLAVTKKEMPYARAVAEGAVALFGEKYGDVVRVVRVGGVKSPVSFEVCGGTHINRTGDIGFFHIISEGSIGSGMRRIEAVTGSGAEALIEERVSTLENVAHQLQVPAEDVQGRLDAVLKELDAERKRAVALELRLFREMAESLLAQVESIDGVSVLAASVPASNNDVLRHTGDILRERLGSAVIVLGAVWADKPNFLAMVTADLVARGLNAGEIVKEVAREAGGSGGGRPQLGQGGGKEKGRMEQALRLVAKLVRDRV
ncbi:MAG: alanine--tRNA ligase [Chloroflexota bacterium]|nr:alanine--tRNA ligase [Chloroflexota bacterium]